MKKINITKVKIADYKSPRGKFGLQYRSVSAALGRRGHPFDLGLVTLPPGKANYPYHLHTAQWEMYIVVSGAGQVRTPKARTRIRAGDVFVCPPNEPHQVLNTGKRDLQYYIIADNPVSDCCYYPDSDKWALPSKIVRVKGAKYFDGEE